MKTQIYVPIVVDGEDSLPKDDYAYLVMYRPIALPGRRPSMMFTDRKTISFLAKKENQFHVTWLDVVSLDLSDNTASTMADEKSEQANNFFRESGGVNPSAFRLGYMGAIGDVKKILNIKTNETNKDIPG